MYAQLSCEHRAKFDLSAYHPHILCMRTTKVENWLVTKAVSLFFLIVDLRGKDLGPGDKKALKMMI